jgi:hypothetical protein
MGRIYDLLKSQNIPVPEQTKRQILAFDRAFSKMATKIKVLELEILSLHAKVNPFEREVDCLKHRKQEGQGTTTPSQVSESLPEIKEKIMLALAKGSLDTLILSEKLDISAEKVMSLATEMLDVGLVGESPTYGFGPTLWELAQGGRKYLIDRDLLN